MRRLLALVAFGAVALTGCTGPATAPAAAPASEDPFALDDVHDHDPGTHDLTGICDKLDLGPLASVGTAPDRHVSSQDLPMTMCYANGTAGFGAQMTVQNQDTPTLARTDLRGTWLEQVAKGAKPEQLTGLDGPAYLVVSTGKSRADGGGDTLTYAAHAQFGNLSVEVAIVFTHPGAWAGGEHRAEAVAALRGTLVKVSG